MFEFTFKDGKFQNGISEMIIEGDFDKSMDANGFHKSYKIGTEDCGGYELWGHSCGHKFMISHGTPSHYFLVLCESWPDLIELQFKLSTIAIASMLHDDHVDAVDELLWPTVKKLERKKFSK